MRVRALFVTTLLCALATPAGAAQPGRAPIEPILLDVKGPTSAFVHTAPGRHEAALAAAVRAGLDPAQVYESIGVFVALGTADGFRALANSTSVEWIEANRALHLSTDSSHVATRSEDLYRGADGTPFDGTGVGVAVVDTGIDGTIPALQAPVSRGDNFKILCPVPGAAVRLATVSFMGCPTPTVAVPMEDSDTIALGGHGTHVAGIIAGSETEVVPADTARPPMTVHGAAPGAAIYGIGAGAALSVDNAMDGLQWVLDNHDQVSPAIRVVNNSWGTSYEDYTDPDDPSQPSQFFEDGYRLHRALWKMQDALVDAGVVVVFAAGNSGGGLGAAPATTAQCINPTPGVICVANYNDLGSGSRSGVIDGTSSRGQRSQPSTWPDIAAPGTGIISTCRPTLPLCSVGSQINDEYFSLSGTSMAAPHVAGIVAQMLQVDPTLTPAEVENLLEDTAHKFTWGSPYGRYVDETNPDDESSFEKGHGLVDALAAVQRADSASPAPAGPDPILLTASQIIPGQAATSFFEPTVESNSSVTRAAFEETCDPSIPAVDGAVFEIPEELSSGDNLITASGSNLFGLWDFNMWMYTEDCERNGGAMGGIFGDVSGSLPSGTRYVVVTNHFFGLTTAGITVQPPPLRFTGDTASSGQFSDAAVFGALATSIDETPLSGQPLTFALEGPGELTWELATGADGIARESHLLELRPGDYTLRVSASGGPLAGVTIERAFTLLPESTVLTLLDEGHGVNRSVTAMLLDDDGTPVVGREVALYTEDGDAVAGAITDGAGVARFDLPPQYRSPNHVFQATFCGDAYYSGSPTAAPSCG